MSKLRVPYQCLQKSGNLLVAARGSSIDLFSLEDHSLLSTWKCPVANESSTKEAGEPTTQKLPSKESDSPAPPAGDVSPPAPPAKRRKLSDGEDSKKPLSEGKAKKKSNRSEAVSSGLDAPAIITLTVTKAGHHVIATTGDDKTIRVFEIVVEDDGKHHLKSVSQRPMPKRPCAVAVTDDDSTIISADKFGDIYSLPLLFSESAASPPETPAQETKSTPRPFKPAANDLTVHSVRNLKALANQQRQTNRAPEKSEPKFEHKLLLGHVSMLTDIALVSSQGRSHIVSADRDEHIRISRGIPQTHIIEGFCLGHTEFISRLCAPRERPDLLISGGGDNELFVWEWLTGTLVSKADLQSLVGDVMREIQSGTDDAQSKDEVKVTVSNITHARLSEGNASEDIIIATSEGVPALFTFLLTPKNELKYIQTVKLPGNALAVVAGTSNPQNIVVSVDSITKPGSTTERRADTEEAIEPLRSYRFEGHQVVAASAFEVAGVDDEGTSVKPMNFLYNLDNLRKRDGEAKELD